MRRISLIIVTVALALAAPLITTPAQATIPPITGTLLSASGDFDLPLAGATVQLYTDTGSGPGASAVNTTTTAADGSFSLGVGSDPGYYVKVTYPDYRTGFLGDGYVQTSASFYDTYGSGENLGDVYMVPAYIRGYVINPATGRRVSGVKVTARDQRNETPEAVDTTDSRGVFVLTGIECEDDCKLYFRGHPVNYENGYRACSGGVQPTWGAACASPLAFIGKVKLQHL